MDTPITTIQHASLSSATEPAALVDALNTTFGRHAGKRASHAKGFCARGSFIPAADLSEFVDGPLFGARSATATLRFSVGGGNPNASDKSRTVRGLGLRIAARGQHWDLVLVSEPVFFAASPESFISFLAARVPDPLTKQADPAKIAEHNARFPDGVRQPALLASHAAPLSYATTPYFSNNAFVFTSHSGQQSTARLIVSPAAGIHYLSPEQEADFPNDFLEADLDERLLHGPLEFDILAQLPGANDSLRDPSERWTGAGRVYLGRLKVAALTAEECDGLVFMPLNLPAGITPSDDPVLLARGEAYAFSLARRQEG